MNSSVLTMEIQRGRRTFFVLQGSVEGVVTCPAVTEYELLAQTAHYNMSLAYLQMQKNHAIFGVALEWGDVVEGVEDIEIDLSGGDR